MKKEYIKLLEKYEYELTCLQIKMLKEFRKEFIDKSNKIRNKFIRKFNKEIEK